LNGEVCLKPISERGDKKKKKIYIFNAKAMIAFFLTFNHVEFTMVKNCKRTFEIQKLLEVTCCYLLLTLQKYQEKNRQIKYKIQKDIHEESLKDCPSW
jgi:hypothetical protein